MYTYIEPASKVKTSRGVFPQLNYLLLNINEREKFRVQI